MKIENINTLANRVKCMNEVNTYVNTITPLLIDELKKGFKQKEDNSLFKKDKERLYKIINSLPHFRALLRCTEYTITFEVDAHYQVNTHGCNYYKQFKYVYDVTNDKYYDFEPLPMVTLEQLEKATSEIARLKDEKYKIECDIRTFERLLY